MRPRSPIPPPPDQPYVLMPIPLALDLRNSPLAIGLYLLIARSYLVHQAPIPLSASDVQAYDSSAKLSRGAVTRALDRLTAGGWLIATARPGHKSAYLPAWGGDSDTPTPWAVGQPVLGRPSRVKTARVPVALLDICLGRLTPHAQHVAIITRYLTRPALALSDVGAYGLAGVGAGAPTAALTRLGLANSTGVLAPPAPEALLARASQPLPHGDTPDAPALSSHGLRRVGLAPIAPAPTEQPLFFVPPGVIGPVVAPVIGGVIGDEPGIEAGVPASAPRKAAPEASSAGSHGVIEAEGADRTTPPPPMISGGGGGGGDVPLPRRRGRQAPIRGRGAPPARGQPDAAPAPTLSAPPDAPPEVLHALLAVGVRRDVAHQLARQPAAQVARVIAQARARQGVRDIAGWVVSALRALPDTEPQPVAPPPKVSDLAILTHPGLTNHERMRWLTRFRNADPADRPAVLVRFHAEHPRDESNQEAPV